MKIQMLIACAIFEVVAATPVLAHHSFAMFDLTRKVTVQGTVVKFEWSNPHVWIHVRVPDQSPTGSTEVAIEAPAVSGLTRVGWDADSLKPGDKVTIQYHPLKSGAPGGGLYDVMLEDGRHLGQTGIQKERDHSGDNSANNGGNGK
jgi:hypothetical protein